MIDYSFLYQIIKKTPLNPWLSTLPAQVEGAFDPARFGNLEKWMDILRQLPDIKSSHVDFNIGTVSVGNKDECDESTQQVIKELLLKLGPWKKGPYSIFDVRIDSEWRSDWKWDRLSPHIKDLKGKLILDVGCSNGYHCWRMVGKEAKLVIGIDPSMLSIMQFHAIRHFMTETYPMGVLPLRLNELPENLRVFDSAFSMGVLYHQRSPIDHLLNLRNCLKKGGELVLETLVIDGPLGQSLVPEERYAKMPNVWFIPTIGTLKSWMKRCGYTEIHVIGVQTTTTEEQRATEWMTFESLSDFLDQQDPTLTIEGLPAPKRAIVRAKSS